MFRCDLCDKGYARVAEYEGHSKSYDHQHRQRQKESRQMKREVLREGRMNRGEDETALRPVRVEEGPGSRQTRGGFKKAFGSEEERAGSVAKLAPEEGPLPQTVSRQQDHPEQAGVSPGASETGSHDGYDSYDPAYPTSD